MNYVFQFNVVWEHLPALLHGVFLTLEMSVMSIGLGSALAMVCAYGQVASSRAIKRLIGGYIETIRNTPVLVQVFVFYFSLPILGLKVSPFAAAVAALTINLGAYACEILRAGIESVPRGQVEAGRALGLSRLQTFRFVIFFPALKTVFPALSSQFILLMLSSSVVSTISAVELTAVTNSLQSTTFRAFEFYFVVAALYLGMSLALKAVMHIVYWLSFERNAPSVG